MDLLTSSIVSLLFILIGFFTLLFMLKVQGNPKEQASNRLLTRLHRIFGYIFLVLFLVMFVFMVKKVSGFSSEFSPRVTIHFVVAVILIPLFLVKLLIARFFKRLYPNLVILGLSIFFLSFTMVGITTGYSLMTGPPAAWEDMSVQTVNADEQNESQQQDITASDPGSAADLIHKKCTACHNLERVKKARKTQAEWQITIEKMIKFSMNPDLLTSEETTSLSEFLASEAVKNL